MKTLTTVVAIALSGNLLAQIVPSSCNGLDSVKNIYYEDAVRLAVKRIFEINSPDTINVTIRQENIDSCLSSLIAVYNATGLPARDTVIDILQIHTQEPNLKAFSIEVDTVNPWTTSWKQSVTLTGDSTIDILLSKYGLTLIDYLAVGSQGWATFQTDSFLNIYALVDSFKLLPTVVDVQRLPTLGDAPDILYSVLQDSTQKLIYRYGWGDCFNGCLYSRYWEFKIYQDCSVEYLGSYGTALPITSIIESDTYYQSTIIYPNPTTGKVTLANLSQNEKVKVTVYNVLGELVYNQLLIGQQADVSYLPSGVYVFQITQGNTAFSKQVIKF